MAKRDETRRKLLETALDLFKAKGFAETTMREIASKSDMALGAAYYHFESKDSMVQACYGEWQGLMEAEIPAVLKEKTFEARLVAAMRRKFDHLRPHRHLLWVIFRTAADPASPLSPFGRGTAAIRERSIGVFRAIVEGESGDPALTAHLPRLLWLYHMGLIFFWMHDESKGQRKTDALLVASARFMALALKVLRLPFAGALRRQALQLLESAA
ncbi:MAG: TetR family transcriptional regulator [Elusimicrobia bacterium]|nr:TetR family transcriptional regulator [Elusimicrobiota bacterium]